MNYLSQTLLMYFGVIGFHGAAVHLDEFTDKELHERYDRAFKDDGKPYVVVVVDGRGNLTIVNSVGQICGNLGLFTENGGIDQVLRIPITVWEGVRPTLEAHPLKEKIRDFTH